MGGGVGGGGVCSLLLYGCLVDLAQGRTENQPYLLLTLGPCLCPILYALRKECTGDLGLGMDDSRHSPLALLSLHFFYFHAVSGKSSLKNSMEIPCLRHPGSATFVHISSEFLYISVQSVILSQTV